MGNAQGVLPGPGFGGQMPQIHGKVLAGNQWEQPMQGVGTLALAGFHHSPEASGDASTSGPAAEARHRGGNVACSDSALLGQDYLTAPAGTF